MRQLLLILCLASPPAFGQDVDHDTVTIAAGAGLTPRYDGASEDHVVPIGAVRGKVSGISFTTVGTAAFVNIIPSHDGPGTKFSFGPMAHVTLNRSSLKAIRDTQIIALGRIPVAVEVGGHAGITRTGLITSAYDSLNADVAVSYDVTGIHDSIIVTPSVNYGTPLSSKTFVGISASADYVGGGYARKYFGVTPAQSPASGLAAYAPGDGFKNLNFGAFGAISVTGDLRHGLSVFAIGNYARLLGAFARSPVVRDRNQLFGGLGLAYTF